MGDITCPNSIWVMLDKKEDYFIEFLHKNEEMYYRYSENNFKIFLYLEMIGIYCKVFFKDLYIGKGKMQL
jgi:hypothetical protein